MRLLISSHSVLSTNATLLCAKLKKEKNKKKFRSDLRRAGRSLERQRASIVPPKQNDGREVWTFKRSKLNRVQMISFRERCRSSAAVPQRPTTRQRGPASFVCALPGCRVWCALLWMANSCEMLLLLQQTLLFCFFFCFFLSPPPLLLFAITTTGAPHTQSFYTAETTWGFPPTGQKIKIIEPRCLQNADTPDFYYGNATGAQRLCFLLPLKCFLFSSYWVLSGTICSFTRLLYSNERNPIKKTRLYSVGETIQTIFILIEVW